MALQLRPLRREHETDARRAHAELASDAFDFLLGWDQSQPWADYLRKLDGCRHGLDLSTSWVASTFLGAFVGAELVGRISIRHELNDFLTNFGGHIGYCVRPAYRRRGYASEILRQGLVIVRAEGVDRVLVTCDDDNAASARVIERNGGVLEDVRAHPEGPARRRYWIDS
ncbi:MAG TPA: GNAT family N-acetyltransferase [Solirubrobacteraceae bacterium]|nr:GNAT family N-acetyltransferase [Solirubrobacteraceae bacterium]